MKKKAVVLLSGGLDSSTVLAIAKHDFECYALSINYGQKHNAELKAAAKIAKSMHVEHQIIDLPIQQLLRSALTTQSIDVPNYLAQSDIPHIPSTYVPARNTIMLSLALAWAESLEANDIFYGANSLDYSGYPDCRIEYVHSFEKMANLATKVGVEAISQGFTAIKIHTPIIHLNKAQIIQLGMSLGVNFSQTVSCYQANENGEACGRCDACVLRKKGFADALLPDVTIYAESI
jgi:7-cyano-7-deazaguanine synthase